jgi:hypothetical protein
VKIVVGDLGVHAKAVTEDPLRLLECLLVLAPNGPHDPSHVLVVQSGGVEHRGEDRR